MCRASIIVVLPLGQSRGSRSAQSVIFLESGVHMSKTASWVDNLLPKRCPRLSSTFFFFMVPSQCFKHGREHITSYTLLLTPCPSMPYNPRYLHALGDVFSKVVEAMSEVGMREEECRLVERETEKMLSRQGGNTRFQVPSPPMRCSGFFYFSTFPLIVNWLTCLPFSWCSFIFIRVFFFR